MYAECRELTSINVNCNFSKSAFDYLQAHQLASGAMVLGFISSFLSLLGLLLRINPQFKPTAAYCQYSYSIAQFILSICCIVALAEAGPKGAVGGHEWWQCYLCNYNGNNDQPLIGNMTVTDASCASEGHSSVGSGYIFLLSALLIALLSGLTSICIWAPCLKDYFDPYQPDELDQLIDEAMAAVEKEKKKEKEKEEGRKNVLQESLLGNSNSNSGSGGSEIDRDSNGNRSSDKGRVSSIEIDITSQRPV